MTDRQWTFHITGRQQPPEYLTDRQIARINQNVAEFESKHYNEDSWNILFDPRPHYSGGTVTGQDVSVVLINSDFYAQLMIDVYGSGEEYWYEHTLTPIHGSHEDFTDTECEDTND